MKTSRHILVLLLIAFGLVACQEDTVTPTETAVSVEPTATTIVVEPTDQPMDSTVSEAGEESELSDVIGTGITISELLLGMPDSNSTEFIELYNPTAEPIDLTNWTLVYLQNEGDEETVLYRWRVGEPAMIPGHGHYLLVHEGKDVGVTPDGWFVDSLLDRRGGLILRDREGTAVDVVGWGDAPADVIEGNALPIWDAGQTVERLPMGAAGNGVDSNDNAADFVVNAPNPQNSGSNPMPMPEVYLDISVEMPEQVDPGIEFDSIIRVVNSGAVVSDVLVSVPIPEKFEVVAFPDGGEVVDGRILFAIPEMAADESVEATIRWATPFTYIDNLLTNYTASADGRMMAFGEPTAISVAGGAVPIDVARTLIGNNVTIEGVATMYTGGFFAGSGTKFYIEDETGGVQVYVPSEAGARAIEIGDVVRVTGDVELYRDSIEVVPADVEVDIEQLGEGESLAATAVSVEQNESDDTILGRLNVIEGVATRVEEFSFSYEMDLTDDLGNTTLVYIEKDTGMNAENLEIGNQYRVTGISEFYSTIRQIKPRIQEDIAEIFPPELFLYQTAANNIQPGELMTYTITAVNHMPDPLTGLEIGTRLPTGGVTLLEVLDGGEAQTDGTILWQVDDLAGGGEALAVRYVVQVDDDVAEIIEVIPAAADAIELESIVLSQAYQTFVGSGVPLWAIQGEGDRSPYVATDARTVGVVTAVFPELGGYWMQSLEPDNNPATSEGVFVLDSEHEVAVGDEVEIYGRIREISGQTTIVPAAEDGVVILSSENHLPEAVVYNPPADPIAGEAYKEAREGMLVIVPQGLAIAPTTQYGEYALVTPAQGVATIRRTDDPVGFIIFVDDGSSITHEDQSSMAYVVAKGDTVTNLIGPLAYTFGNYKIEPIAVPEILSDSSELPSIAPASENQLSVATFNVENLFDPFAPFPSSPPSPSLDEYRQRLYKTAEAIVAMGAPDIIGLQEVENIGILEDLAEQEQLLDFSYAPYLIEGTDSRGIDVAYLVRSDKVTVDGFANYTAPEGLTSRPPLVLTTTINLASGPQTIYLLNNHFTSLAGGEEATEPRRTAQAAWNVTIMEQIRADNPDAQFIVMGDLNSFYQTLPINALQEGGLDHAYEFFADESEFPYTYIFEGRTQSLDHILMSPELFAHLMLVEALHIDADYPLIDLEDSSAKRVSDHDPLVAIFSFE